MNAFILVAAALIGPPVPQTSLTIHIHLGRDHRSAIARSELKRHDEWFLLQRIKIEKLYHITVDEDELDQPSYQIGKDDRQRFRPGTFIASGTFMLSLLSIAETSRWESENNDFNKLVVDPKSEDLFQPEFYDINSHRLYLERRPEVFPPVMVNENESRK